MNVRLPTMRIGAALVGTLLLLAACGSGSDTSTSSTAAAPEVQADTADTPSFPQFEATTVSGGQLEFGSLEGQDTVVWFWAPW